MRNRTTNLRRLQGGGTIDRYNTAMGTKGSERLPARIAATLVGWIVFWIVGIVLFPGAFCVFLTTLPFDRNGRILHQYTSWWAALYIRLHPGWRLQIHGRERLPANGAAVLVANHQSQVDPVVIFSLMTPFKPVSKSAVMWVPIFGWNMMFNRYITLSRGERKSVARMAEDCRYWLRRGVPVMIYPEGTRSPDGEIKEFKNGAFTLAVEENCPVVPIVIDGTRSAMPKNSVLLGLSAELRVRVLEPVWPDSPDLRIRAGHPRERAAALREHVRQRMIQELAQMRGVNLPTVPAGEPVPATGPELGGAVKKPS